MADDSVERNVYVAISGLWVNPADSDLSASELGITISTEIEKDAGVGILGAIGFSSGNIRSEVELAHRGNDWDKMKGISISFEGVTVSLPQFELSVPGDWKTWSVMGNGFYDFEPVGMFHPYLGLGVGLALHDASFGGSATSIDGTLIDVQKVSDEDIVFAYQAMVGASIPVSETAELRIGYRYFASADTHFDDAEISYATHNVEIGMQFLF